MYVWSHTAEGLYGYQWKQEVPAITCEQQRGEKDFPFVGILWEDQVCKGYRIRLKRAEDLNKTSGKQQGVIPICSILGHYSDLYVS